MNTAERRRTGRRIWVDPRLLIGIGLVVVSLVGVWFVVQSSTRSVSVYAASTTLSAGDTLDASELVETQVRLGQAGDRYLAEVPAEDAVVTRTVLEGELIPRSAIGAAEEVSVNAIVIESDTSLPERVTAGALVDLWAAELTEDGAYGPPAVLVAAASVARVADDEGMVNARGATVEVLVPSGKVAAVLAAIARDDSISLVPAG